MNPDVISIPELCLVALIGPSGCGKSTFARRHFKRTEVLSSDFCRGLVSDDENSQAATGDAFDVLNYVVAKRLARGLLTVIDATNVQEEVEQVAIERQPLWNNRRWDTGPFDIIGDVHGCIDELLELLAKLGYDTTQIDCVAPPPGRKAVFLGDLVDRGPDSPGVLRLVM